MHRRIVLPLVSFVCLLPIISLANAPQWQSEPRQYGGGQSQTWEERSREARAPQGATEISREDYEAQFGQLPPAHELEAMGRQFSMAQHQLESSGGLAFACGQLPSGTGDIRNPDGSTFSPNQHARDLAMQYEGGAKVLECYQYAQTMGPAAILSGCACFVSIANYCEFGLTSTGQIRVSGSGGATNSACMPFAPFFLF